MMATANDNRTPSSAIAPRNRYLNSVETVTTFNSWRDNMIYILTLNNHFTPFLLPDATWGKYSSANPNRGFTDDEGHDANPPTGLKKEEKLRRLDLFLGQIANWAIVISRNQIVKFSGSLKEVWGKLREHYGLQTSGSKFIDIVNVRLDTGERYEDFYQRLLAFFEDNLLVVGDEIKHHGEAIAVSEELTPSLENMIVLVWLERIHISLPALVKQKYGAELRNRTLASLKSEISQALDSLLDELKSSDRESRIMRSSTNNNNSSNYRNNNNSSNNRNNNNSSNNRNNNSNRRYDGSSSRARSGGARSTPSCCLCESAKRPSTNHWLSRCPFLPESDRQRIRFVEVFEEDQVEEDVETEVLDTVDNACFMDAPPIRRVTTRRSPHLKCFLFQFPVFICLDTGAESNLMSRRFAVSVGVKIFTATQGAVQADPRSPLVIIGEVRGLSLTRGPYTFTLDALVTEQDFGDIIGGEPFLDSNDIAIRSSKKQIIIHGRDVVPYDTA